MAEHLFLALDDPILTARVHPVVALTILDHHNRRDGDDCVVGSLLGTRSDNIIEIKSAFGIPHTETDEDLKFDMEYHKNMLDLHLKANPEETLVGWYSSASIIDENSAIIHDLYWKEIGDDSPSPVHLTVDCEVYGGRMEITPFIADRRETDNQQTLCRTFYPINYEIDTSDTEQGCLAALMKTKNTESLKTRIDAESENLTSSLNSLLQMLTVVTNYVDDVVVSKSFNPISTQI
uniref:MPN domain-containing protein n=1 Tax=Vannella robusta TaxID=1487602 RepID=A0A7S4IM77_9EUKA|mmetsp:Transcript_5024/g.6129  ORF Transcript_5024/g.6129 Transcript_5024/m.6129 type:complete len:235 (+) Transcript_5024:20-724(+)